MHCSSNWPNTSNIILVCTLLSTYQLYGIRGINSWSFQYLKAFYYWRLLLLLLLSLTITKAIGGGQPVLRFEQCFILFSSFPLLLAFVVGGLGFEFCVFVAGWRICSSEWVALYLFIIIITTKAITITESLLLLCYYVNTLRPDCSPLLNQNEITATVYVTYSHANIPYSTYWLNSVLAEYESA